MPRSRTFREAGVTLTLYDRGTHHELMIGDVPILTSALLGTERDFGRIVAKSARRVVVGGLGFGSTLAGVLEKVGASARVLAQSPDLPEIIGIERSAVHDLVGTRLADATLLVRKLSAP